MLHTWFIAHGPSIVKSQSVKSLGGEGPLPVGRCLIGDSRAPAYLSMSEPEILTGPVKLRDQELLSKWQSQTFDLLARLDEATRSDNHQAAKVWSIAAGVATDKTLLLGGRPTSIVAGLHEHRHTLPQLASRLLDIGRRVGVLDAPALPARALAGTRALPAARLPKISADAE